MRKIAQFFRDVWSELKKVTWPDREDVVASTKVVIVSVAFFALVLGVLDLLLVWIIDKLL
ncbi:preprotein translocase subunit SecE [Spirochaetia bacterium 38H-sp]|uniref:Protein translocase subunit SecE n=1 Tax=Rarispira pelagica TaxID=3141764 RepID=A0ABU9UDX8_9SPIR